MKEMKKESWRKMFSEFPFLMGVKNDWDRLRDTIKVETLSNPQDSEQSRDLLWRSKYRKVFFFVSNDNRIALMPCSSSQAKTIGEYYRLLEDQMEDIFCEIVVVVNEREDDLHWDRDVTILHTRGTNLKELL